MNSLPKWMWGMLMAMIDEAMENEMKCDLLIPERGHCETCDAYFRGSDYLAERQRLADELVKNGMPRNLVDNCVTSIERQTAED